MSSKQEALTLIPPPTPSSTMKQFPFLGGKKRKSEFSVQKLRNGELHISQVGYFFNIDESAAKTVLKDISNVNFPCLKQVWFLRSDVESIEVMARINISTLEILNAGNIENNKGQNVISTIRNLRKSNWPSLKYLFLCKNYDN